MSAFLPALQSLGVLGYWFILLISFAEAFVLTGWVVPGTVLVVIAGGLAAHGVYDFWDLVFFASVGAILGDGVSYELGHRGKAFIERSPFLKKQAERGKLFFQKHQTKGIFLGRFIGWIRPIVPFVAGTMGMPRSRFYIANIVGAIAWAISYLGLGYVFGAAWKLALFWATRAGIFLLIVALLIAILAWLWRWAVRKGQTALTVLLSIGHSVYAALQANPYIRSWENRHQRLLSFLRDRFSVRQFTGLPLTLLGIAFLTSTYVLLGIVEDYITGDLLTLVDVRLTNLLFAFRDQTALRVFYAITLLATSGVAIALAVTLTTLLWFSRKRIYILTLWMSLIGSQGVTVLAKLLFHRPRPEGLMPAILEDSYSFPSGHATSGMAFYGFLAYLYIRNHPSWKTKVSVFFYTLLIVVLVDISRLYLGVHFLSDVLAGNMVGFTILLFAISVTEWLLWEREKDSRSVSWIPVGAVSIVGSFIITAILILSPSPWKEAKDVRKIVNIGSANALILFEDQRLPRYTETIIGTSQEPLNFIVMGSETCLLDTFFEARWIRAEQISFPSTYKLLQSALLNQPFPTAPMTPSFYNGLPHDFGFQQATNVGTVRSRHHTRFWKTNYATASGSVFVGTASLDTSLKWGITHSIDPAIDVERDLLATDIVKTGKVAHEERIPFVPSALGKNFTGDPFFTDGNVVILILKPCSS